MGRLPTCQANVMSSRAAGRNRANTARILDYEKLDKLFELQMLAKGQRWSFSDKRCCLFTLLVWRCIVYVWSLLCGFSDSQSTVRKKR